MIINYNHIQNELYNLMCIYDLNPLYDFTSKEYLTLFKDDLTYFNKQIKDKNLKCEFLVELLNKLIYFKDELKKNLYAVSFYCVIQEIENYIQNCRVKLLGGIVNAN